VRVRDGDRADAAGGIDCGGDRVVDERNAVPEQVLNEKRALPDSEARLGANPDQSRLQLLDPRAVANAPVGERGPLLAFVTDVLALVAADRARLRRRSRRPELRTAGDAEVGIRLGDQPYSSVGPSTDRGNRALM
jgi:hypothetical protein